MRRSRLSTAARIVKRHRRICSNASLAGYRIPSILDVPAILENEAVVRPSDPVHSARPRVGESATLGVSPAIANAIDDAVGVHLSELPLNAEAGTERSASRRRDRSTMRDAKTIHFKLIEIAPTKPSSRCCDRIDSFGARESCGQGLCGCCTVLVNSGAVSGCPYLAALVDGADVVTIEHLDSAGVLDPIQESFIETGAFHCGFLHTGLRIDGKAIA